MSSRETHSQIETEDNSRVSDNVPRTFPCEGCGSDLEFNIAVQRLKCPYCGFEKEIDLGDNSTIEEQDLEAMLATQAQAKLEDANPSTTEYDCETCNGTVLFQDNVISTECPYCGSPVQKDEVHGSPDRIKTDAVLPFMVERELARTNLRKWVAGRWFAPNDFKRRGAQGTFSGLYMPHWTFDSLTYTEYAGERGEVYIEKNSQGNTKIKVRWYPASGRFQRFFDDVLVCALRDAKRKLMQQLEPWHLDKMVPFNQNALAGYVAMTYEVDLKEGFSISRARMNAAIEAEIKQRIGGDRQRIHHVNSRYDALTFKNIMLPVWMLAYRYKDKSYQVVVNASTGEVQGERPWSWVKILLTILTGAAVVGGFILANQQ